MDPTTPSLEQIFLKLGIALGLGLLVGMQRERVHTELAGIRTFALLTVLGAVSGLLGVYAVVAGGLGVALLLVVGNLVQPEIKEADPGLTTEVAALLMYGVGAYLTAGKQDYVNAVAIAVGGATALLLHFKAPMHTFVARIGEKDVTAIMQFVLIALVIFPVLPDQAYDPFGVLNPHQVWLMVVLIVGINLGGYVCYKLFGQQAGAVLGGALGGLISSTATTVSYSRRTQGAAELAGMAALVILIATAISYARVLIEIAVVVPGRFWLLAPPLAIMLAAMVLVSLASWFRDREGTVAVPEPGNPAELVPALIFAGLYATVILAVAAAKEYLGATGLYTVAILSGLHDMDAITLSTARLVEQDQLPVDIGWRIILTASLANLATKGAIAAALGDRRLAGRVAAWYGIGLAIGIGLLVLWPG